MAKSDETFWNLAMGWGCIATIALLVCDVKLPEVAQCSEFLRAVMPAARLAAQNHLVEAYSIASPLPAEHLPAIVKFAAAFSPISASFRDMPLCAVSLMPLAGLPAAFPLLVWQAVSLLALALSTFMFSRAAAHVELDADDSAHVGWACLSFAPLLVLLFQGGTGICFGVLPIAMGYWLMVRNKQGFAGLVWALTVLKPAYLLIPIINALAQIMARRLRCAVGLVAGIALVLLIANASQHAAFAAWFSLLGWFGIPPAQDPRLDITLPHAILSAIPAQREGLAQIVSFVGLMLGAAAFIQFHKIIQSEDKDLWLAPFATILGAFLTPFILPHLPFQDLSVLLVGGLVIYCMDWREHLEWRLTSLVRVQWICINAYALLFYFQRNLTHPGELIVVMLLFFQRFVEVIRFLGETPEFEREE